MSGILFWILIFWLFSLRDRDKSEHFLPFERQLVVRAWWLFFGLFVASGPFLVLLSAGSLLEKSLGLAFFAAVFLLTASPFNILRLTLIPLGWWRIATLGGWLAALPRWARLRSGAKTAGLLAWGARLRAGPLPEFLKRWQLKESWRILGAELVNLGLIEALEGRRERAAILMDTVLRLPNRASDRISRRLALEWQALDSTATGAWLVEDIGRARPFSRIRFFLDLVGKALRQPSGILPLRLRVARCLLPGPTAGQLLARARAARPATEEATDQVSLRPLLEQTAIAVQEPSARRLERLTRSWCAALDGEELKAAVATRAAALGLDPESSADQVAAQVRGALESWSRSLPFGSLSGSWGVVEDVESDLDLLEAAAAALERRKEQDIQRPLAEEVAEWVQARLLFERVGARDPIAQVNAYRTLVGPLTAWAAWLWNTRAQQPFAYAIFSWIRDLAEGFDDEPIAAVMRSNLGKIPKG